MNIIYKEGIIPPAEQICKLYDNSGLKRPTQDKNRISTMYSNSNLVISAWDGTELVGIARSLTDFC